MGERVKIIRKHFGLSQAQFAQKVNRSPGFISNVETGRSDISEETINVIVEVYGVNKEWLLTGEGDMGCGDAADKAGCGKRVEEVRMENHLTQKEFADKIGYTTNQVDYVEVATANFGAPASNAPWVLVSAGSSDQEAFNNLTTVLSEYTGFHQIRIVDKVDGNLVVQYDLDGENAIYDIGNQFVWIKHSMGVGSGTGYIYAKYDATTLTHNTTGFMVNVQTPNKTSVAKYDNLSDITFKDAPDKTYWAYAAGEQARKDDGSLQTMITLTKEERHNSYTVWETTNTAIDSSRISYDAAKNMYSITFDVPGTYIITVKYRNDITDGTVNAYYAMQHATLVSGIIK